MPKVLFLSSLSTQVSESIVQHAQAGFDVQIASPTLPEEELKQLVQDADFLILFPARIADNVLRSAQKLKLIQLVGVGFDAMNLPLGQELGIPVATNGGANAIDVAEHTIAMILSLYRRFVELDHNVRNNRWKGIDTGLTTYTIHNKTVGIVGFGKIGQQVARLLGSWGARLLYHDAYPVAGDLEAALGVERVSLDTLLEQSDIVTLHVPLMAETHGLINENTLTKMKKNAILINTCRGPVVQESALVHALSNGQIAGAALDVFEQEPIDAANPLLAFDNVLLSPHSAGITWDTWSRRGEFICANIERVWAGDVALATVSL